MWGIKLIAGTTLVFILAATLGSIAGGIIILLFGLLITRLYFRTFVQRIFGLVIVRLLSDKYHENLMELWNAIRRSTLLNVLEINLRAEQGKIIKRPLGSSKQFLGFDGLMFIPAQLVRLPLEAEVPVDMRVTIGPKAKKPLIVEIPLLISGMGYGITFSEEARVALASAAKQTGTAICSGEGPFLAEERLAAGKYIWQIARGSWGRNPEAIAQADMIEVQMGQGARIGAHFIEPNDIKGKAQKLMQVSPAEVAKSKAVIPGINSPWDWLSYVQDLRLESGGKPIALKFMAGGRLEADLTVAIEAGFDVIILCGAQGGTNGASPIMEDDFGLPSLQALIRAERFLREQGVRRDISLIADGGYFTPGQCLKAIALGADAIYLGTVPMYALVHGQIDKVMPWEPPTRLVDYNSRLNNRLDVKKAVSSVTNVLQSMVLEMQEGVRGLGKSSLADVGPNDLVALDAWTAEVTGVQKA